jgi:hypothetical protein
MGVDMGVLVIGSCSSCPFGGCDMGRFKNGVTGAWN